MENYTAEISRISADSAAGRDKAVLQIVIDDPVARIIRRRGVRHVALGIEDGRRITPLQQRKAYAMLRDIGEYTGYPVEAMKQIMKVEHMMRTGDFEYFSLANCSVTKARE
jgi:hypothetical protein